MKINGRVISGPYRKVIAFPRDGFDVVFRVKAVLDDADFLKLCPRPNPPYVTKPGQPSFQNTEDENFKKALNDWAVRKSDWLNIKALEDTDGLEWSSVRMEDSGSWKNWTEDLMGAGFTHVEIIRIMQCIQEVNGLDETKIEEARKRFLASQVEISNGETNSHLPEQATT